MGTNIYESFLQLVRWGIGHGVLCTTQIADWSLLKALADTQGLSAVVLDGIDKQATNKSVSTNELPVPMKLEWIGEVLQNYEKRYKQYESAISSLAGFYNQHGFKMMVLKGHACSLNWPKPEHRPCGDIDIWLFGRQNEADTALVKEKGIKIDASHHHHTVFEWNGFTVENHYDFINVHHHKSHTEFEKILKEMGQDDSHFIEVNGEKVYLPSPNLHALFLVKHLMLHFVSGEISLRQLLDWAFFAENNVEKIDWVWLNGVLEKYGMKDLYNVFNAICVGDLGFSAFIFKQVQFLPELKKRVLKEILSPEFNSREPKWLIPRLVYKFRRWKASEWKHKLCYKESMWSAFWSGVWNHLLKPSSI